MSPAFHYGLRLVISATQYGIIASGLVLQTKPEIDQRLVVLAAIGFVVAFGTRIKEGLDALPPVYPVPPPRPRSD